MTRHLGESVAAVADGHVTGEERERAFAHLAACPECRAEVERHRAVRQRLAAMQAPVLPPDMAARLLNLSITDPSRPMGLPPSHALPHGRGRSVAVIPLARPARHAFAGRAQGARPHSAGRRRVVAAGILAAAALSGGAMLGTRPAGASGGGNGPSITPGTLELTRFDDTTRSVMLDDPAPALAVAANH